LQPEVTREKITPACPFLGPLLASGRAKLDRRRLCRDGSNAFATSCAITWRRLRGTNQLPKVIAGVRFEDGIEVIEVPANHA
jgi:hypothetical protein